MIARRTERVGLQVQRPRCVVHQAPNGAPSREVVRVEERVILFPVDNEDGLVVDDGYMGHYPNIGMLVGEGNNRRSSYTPLVPPEVRPHALGPEGGAAFCGFQISISQSQQGLIHHSPSDKSSSDNRRRNFETRPRCTAYRTGCLSLQPGCSSEYSRSSTHSRFPPRSTRNQARRTC
jgi:hypothetical protein